MTLDSPSLADTVTSFFQRLNLIYASMIDQCLVWLARRKVRDHFQRIRSLLDEKFLQTLEVYILWISLRQVGLIQRRGVQLEFSKLWEMDSIDLESATKLDLIQRNGLLKILLTAYLTFPEKEVKLYSHELLDFLCAIITKPPDRDIDLTFRDIFTVILVKAGYGPLDPMEYYKERIVQQMSNGKVKRAFVLGIGSLNSAIARTASENFVKNSNGAYVMQVKSDFVDGYRRKNRTPSTQICVYIKDSSL